MSLSYFNNNKWKRKQIYNDWVTEKEKKIKLQGINTAEIWSLWFQLEEEEKKEEEEWPWSWRNAVDEWRKGEPAFLGGKNAGVWFGGKNDLETLDWICFVLTSLFIIDFFLTLEWFGGKNEGKYLTECAPDCFVQIQVFLFIDLGFTGQNLFIVAVKFCFSAGLSWLWMLYFNWNVDNRL